ncbi:hypothetical protein MKX03_032166 [Papaver bracteatum]|nr:hypothetical protein MKX03_032166 [Papaver bracteatum]
MDDQERVFKDGAIVIDGDKIIAINQSSLILAEFGTTGHDDFDIINLNGKIVIPGLINRHVHTSQQLGRGIADDVDLMTWLYKRGQHVPGMARAVELLGLRACLVQQPRILVRAYQKNGELKFLTVLAYWFSSNVLLRYNSVILYLANFFIIYNVLPWRLFYSPCLNCLLW